MLSQCIPAYDCGSECSSAPVESVPLFEGTYLDRSDETRREFIIQLALSTMQRASAIDLVNRMYAWRGYGSNHAFSAERNCATFSALCDGATVGTLTLTVDSDSGLAADDTFEDVLAEFRRSGEHRICELTKFAFSPATTSMQVLASLFHTIFIFGTEKFDSTDLFIEVNPRHIRFYEVLLGFSRVGKMRQNKAVDAPSQLMRLRIHDIGRFIDEQAGRPPGNGKSLYPYFLTAAQECIIQERLADLDKALTLKSPNAQRIAA